MSTPTGRAATIYVCGRCMNPAGRPRMTPADSCLMCTACGKPWKVVEILDPQSIEQDKRQESVREERQDLPAQR